MAQEPEPDTKGHPEWGTKTYCPSSTTSDHEHEPCPYHLFATGGSFTVRSVCVHCGREGYGEVDPDSFKF